MQFKLSYLRGSTTLLFSQLDLCAVQWMYGLHTACSFMGLSPCWLPFCLELKSSLMELCSSCILFDVLRTNGQLGEYCWRFSGLLPLIDSCVTFGGRVSAVSPFFFGGHVCVFRAHRLCWGLAFKKPREQQIRLSS